MVRSVFLLATLFVLFAGEARALPVGQAPAFPDTPGLPCRQKAELLLDQALGFMERNYYRRKEIDWTLLAAQARKQLDLADNCDDAWSSISWCFRQLGEPHSFVMPPASAARYEGHDSPGDQAVLGGQIGEIRGEWIGDSIGYLTIPWVSTTDSLLCERVADSLQAVIARLDSRHISHWIVDLRRDKGGNCWPMLAGIGPLLGNGICGYFVASGETIPFSYYDGSALQGKHVLCRVSNDHGYHTWATHNSVVVLTGARTVSAGEIVALAFKGRHSTCLIGQPTAGLTTANATYLLADRSMLVLTVCREADFTGHVCDGSILPDQFIAAGHPDEGSDAARAAAVSWLQGK